MKKLVFILSLFFSVTFNAQTAEKLFAEANEFYKNADYNKAIELYQNIEKQQLISADLYFNLGNCYYKLNKVAPSIYYYEKALKLDPTNNDAITNLAFAKRMTIDVIEDLPKTFFQRFSAATIQKLPFDTWAVIAVIASFITAVFFLIYYFSGSSKKKLLFFNSSILALFVMLISLFFAFSAHKIEQNNRTAIIFAPKTVIKNAPTKSGDEIFELHEGTKVIVLDELDNWKKIKIADGKTGWILTDDLKEI